MIRIGKSNAFAVYEGMTSSNLGILEFELDDDGLPDYKDYYTNFTDAAIKLSKTLLESPIQQMFNFEIGFFFISSTVKTSDKT